VGDKARGCHTIPIEMGRKPALVTVIVAVTFWSVYAPLGFLASDWRSAALSIAVGAWLVVVSITAIGGQDQRRDRMMHKI
jgi:4-hydroxybenzoate polyprenyltransferase